MRQVTESMEKASKEVAQVSEEGSTPSLEEMLSQIQINTEMYLNNKGRMLAYVQYIDLPNNLTERWFYGKRFRLISEMEMQYNGKPVFQIQSNESNTVDLEKIVPELKEKMGILTPKMAE